MIYYAYELYTGDAYELGVHANADKLDARLASLRQDLAKYGDVVETYAIGTVEAASVDDALNKVRRGDWEYSQFD